MGQTGKYRFASERKNVEKFGDLFRPIQSAMAGPGLQPGSPHGWFKHSSHW